MVDAKELSQAYKFHKSSGIPERFHRNKLIADGRSAQAFANEVINRVKLEFMGAVNDKGQYDIYTKVSTAIGPGGLISKKQSIKELIVGNNILKAVSRLYAELASNKPPTVSMGDGSEDKEKYIDHIDYQKEISEQVFLQSYAGRYLLKCILLDEKVYFETTDPSRYFCIKNKINTSINNSVVKYSFEEKDKQSKMYCEIYSEGQTEYRTFLVKEDVLEEIEHYMDLTDQEGFKKDGLGWLDTYEGWQVVEVKNIFETSDYDEDCIIANRELVVGDTLTSQAFDKIANPLLQVPQSMLEYDQNGSATVRIDDRVVMIGKEDAELKQIALESKVNEWKVHRDTLKEQIYTATGTNEMAFGLSKDGAGSISGESKRRSLERTLATTEVKRGKVIKALEELSIWGIKRLSNSEVEVFIESKEIVSLSTKEKLEIAAIAFEKGIMSLEEAIEYINLTNISTEEEVSKIKGDLNYRDKLTRLLIELAKNVRDNDLQVSLQTQVDELLQEFKLGGE